METKNGMKYFAFISYKRDDQEWAQWLQKKLEHYKFPTNLNGHAELPKEIRPVFRDKSELASGVLADEITRALDQSKYLIIICSRNSANSEWVNKEVQTFIDMGRANCIIPFIIEDAGVDARNCFPQALRELPADKEILGININEMGRDAAAVKTVAQMFGLKFDELWQRHEREKKRRRMLFTSAIVAFAVLMVGIACWIGYQNVLLNEQRWRMLESQSKLVGNVIVDKVKEDSYLSRKLALEILPKDVAHPTDRPYTPEAEKALRTASMYHSAIFNITKQVSSIAYCPDGNLLLATEDTLRILNVKTGEIQKNIPSPGVSEVDCSDVRFSHNGKLMVSTLDNQLFVYETDSWNVIKKYAIDKPIYLAVFSADDKYLLLTSYDCIIRLLDIQKGKICRTIDVASKDCVGISALAVSPDGKQIVFGPEKRLKENMYYSRYVDASDCFFPDEMKTPIKILDFETGRELKSLEGHKSCIEAIDFNPDGTKFLTASLDTTVKIWDAGTGKELLTRGSNGNSMNSACFSHDGKMVVSVSWATKDPIILWNAETGDKMESYSGFVNPEDALFSPDDRLIVSSGSPFRICNIEKERNVLLRGWNNTMKWKYVMSTDGKYLLAANDQKDLAVINLETGKNVQVLHHEDTLRCAAISPDNKTILAGTEHSLYMWNAETGKQIRVIRPAKVHYLSYCSDGKQFMSVSQSGRIMPVDVRDATTGDIVRTQRGSFKNENQIVDNPDGTQSVITSASTGIVVDEVTGEELFALSGHNALSCHSAYNPDRTRMVSTVWDNYTLTVRNVQTGRIIKILTEPTSAIMHVSFSPDGKYLVAASYDNMVRVWETETWEIVQTIDGHTAPAEFAAFTPDGRHIITAAQDTTIRKWDFLPLQELIDETRERFKNVPLTEEEKKRYYLQ